jgi:hypothetical protein
MRRAIVGSVLVALLALMPASALAANHPLLGAGEAQYEGACGLAIGGGGMYVSDYYRDTVETPGGKITNEDPTGPGPCQLALDAAGDLYVNNWHQGVVKYDAGLLISGAGSTIDAGPATGVAVDPGSGDVYVDRRTYVAVYDAPVTAGEAPSEKVGLGSLGNGYGLAVSAYPASAGYIYVPDAADSTVKVYDPTVSETTPIAIMQGRATPQKGFRHLVDGGVTVDNSPTSPSYGHLFVLDNIGFGVEHPEGALDEFDAAGDYRGQIKGFGDAEPSGVAINPVTGEVSVTSGNTERSKVITYGPTAPSRTLTVKKTGSGDGVVSSSPFGISCGEACVALYDEEEKVSVFATPDPHSEFTGWTVTGPGAEPCPGTGPCSVVLLGSDEVTANFEAATQQTLQASVTGSGSLTSEPAGIACPGHCSEEYAEGHTISLVARPAPHFKIGKWTGCGFLPRPNECKVLISGATSVGVEFTQIPQLELGVSLTGSGSGEVTSYPYGISCPGACSEQFDEGATLRLIPSADPRSAFVGWSGAGCEGAGTGVCVVQMSHAQSVVARFDEELGATRATRRVMRRRPRLSLRLLAVGATGASMVVRAPEAGSLAAIGRFVSAGQVKTGGSGPVPMHLTLNRGGRHALADRGEIKTRVKFLFTPRAGGARVRGTKAITFRRS